MEPEKKAKLGSGYIGIAEISENNNENGSPETLMVTLPDHLIVEQILPRLPVKSLLRFKSVCKFWRSTISTLEFAKSRLRFSSSCHRFLLICEDYSTCEPGFFSLSCDECCSNVKELVELEFEYIYATNIELVGCLNGLVCLNSSGESGLFYLWNPATRESRVINYPDHQDFAYGYGFGYVSSLDDYKIAALFLSEDDELDHLFVFSLIVGKWRRISLSFDDYYLVMEVGYNVMSVDDTLYWDLRGHEVLGEAKLAVGFNLVTEQMVGIPWVNWLSGYKSFRLFSMKGCLSLHCYKFDDPGSDFWVLSQHGDWNSWKKLFSVNFSHVSSYQFFETGKCLLQHSGQLKLVDLSEEMPEHSHEGIEFDEHMLGMAQLVERLISPFGTARPDDIELNNEDL